MPRNDQIIRLFQLLRRLEGPRGATLAELTASLPIDSTAATPWPN